MIGAQTTLAGIACEEQGADFIATPARVTELLLYHCPPPAGTIVLDPAAGGGAIIDVLLERGVPRDLLFACEVRESEREQLLDRLDQNQVWIGDWYEARELIDFKGPWPSIICNPPFSQLPRFADACWPPHGFGYAVPRYIALLMPIEELAGKQSTRKFLRHVGAPTDLIPIDYRPWPNVRGVAWYVWQGSAKGSTRLHLR